MSSSRRRPTRKVRHDSNSSGSSAESNKSSESELGSSFSSSRHEKSIAPSLSGSEHDSDHSSRKHSRIDQLKARSRNPKQSDRVLKTQESPDKVEDCYITCKYSREPLPVSHCQESARSTHSDIHHCSPSKQSGTSVSYLTKIVFVGILVLVGIYASTTIYPPQRPSLSDAATSFIVHMQDMELSFRMQSAVFWRVLRAGTKPIFQLENPDQPATFILVIPSDAVSTGECLVRQFTRLVTSLLTAKAALEFRSSEVAAQTPQRVKRDLDNVLNEGFSYGSRVAVIHHLEQLHGESAMMLHAYCDNENAPFRSVVLVLTLYVQETSSMITESDQFVENQLSVLWRNDLGANKFDPLLSRIANSVAFVRPETNEVLKQNKC